jgi:predicted Zn-dependent peptidase
MTVSLRFVPVVLGAVLLTVSPARAQVHVEQLADGMDLIVAPAQDAPLGSFRYVVRSGSGDDPGGKGGLAHLLEHLLLQDRPGPVADLWAAVRRSGALLNAYTSSDATTFSLDAPSRSLLPLAEQLISVVTNPPLDAVRISTELGVVNAEQEFYSGEGSILALVDAALFPSTPGGILGTAASRSHIELPDLVAHFNTFYATTNTALVFVGDVTPEAARQAVDRAVRLPPALPSERRAPTRWTPAVPVDQRVLAPLTVAAFGYMLDAGDAAACEPLASALGLRLALNLEVREPLVSAVRTRCLRMHGHDLLLAFAYTRSSDASDLPNVLKGKFADLVARPLTPGEIDVIDHRLRAAYSVLRFDPQALADRLAERAARPREPEEPLDPGPVTATRLNPRQLRDAATRSFTGQRRILLYFSPFEGA